jgi:gamma-glutamyl-gamma-aminobutyraldehyde dehydrogenase
MSLLTHDEYKAIAARLAFPTQAFIDGKFCPAKSGKTFETVNPATGAVLAHVAACGPATPLKMGAGRASTRATAKRR